MISLQRNFHLAILLVIITSVLIPVGVLAGTSSTNGGVGDANCTASKTITQGSTWTAYVRSQCDLGIGQIGYTWWTVRQYCAPSNAYTTRFQSSVGAVNTNANSFQRSFAGIAYAGCTSSIQLQDLGQHDFKTINNTWRPTVNRYEIHY
ncbi:MAG: hypothetical protein CNIPEHKO_02569 [Anaerolineales bacterium]|nr:hypothetical protein [Anaerolineales bacterium]